MTLTREDPGPLRGRVSSARMATGFATLLTAGAVGGVLGYGDQVVAYAQAQGLQSSDLEAWVRPAAVLVVALPALWTIAAALGLRRVLRRFRVASDFERQLNDPSVATSVPPLRTHLIQLNRTTAGRAWFRLIGSAGLTLLLAVFAAGVGADAWNLPVPHQARAVAWLAVVVLAVFTLVAAQSVRSAQLRSRVERLSSSDLPTARPAAPSAASNVPGLTVRFAGPLRPVSAPGTAPRVLYLRLFDNLAGTDRFVARWRRFGVVHYLRSADQVSAAELRNRQSGDGDRSTFIDDDQELEAFLHSPAPDRSTRRHPVRGLLCHGSYWKQAVIRLLQEVDLVVLDLTGFHPGHSGTAFELQAALDLVEVGRLRLLAATGSDQRYLAAQLRGAWAAMAAGSPNAGPGSRTITVNLG